MQADRDFAFVALDTHGHAATAIVQLRGQTVHGRPIKYGWGKDRANAGALQAGVLLTSHRLVPSERHAVRFHENKRL